MDGRINNLDALRAVAALAVVAFHLRERAPDIVGWPAQFGWIGVDVFFVISGAVIPFSIAKLEERFGAEWPRHYAKHRFFRIYPLYALTCIVFMLSFAPFLAQPAADVVWQIVSHGLMLHWVSAETWSGLLWVSWSLAIEAQFYFLIWLAWPIIKRARIWMVIATTVIVSVVWHWAMRSWFPDDSHLQMLLSQLPGRLHEFGWGIAIFRLLTDQTCKPIARILGYGRFAFVVVGPLLFFTWAAGVANQGGPFNIAGDWMLQAFGHVGMVIVFGIACALLVMGSAQMNEGFVFRLLAPVGTISYGIYLWHTIIVHALAQAGYKNWGIIFVGVLATLAISALSYRYFERPFMDRARDRTNRSGQ